MSRGLIYLSLVAAGALIITACGAIEDAVSVHSCSLNPSDTLPWICTESSFSDECSATEPNVAEKGDGCPSGATHKCVVGEGISTMYHYNLELEEAIGIAEEGCDQLSGTFSAL